MPSIWKFGAAVAAAVVTAEEARDYTNYDFKAYLEEFGKSYHGHEHDARKAVFEKNMDLINKHNREYKAGQHTWWAGVSHITDYTEDEFSQMRSNVGQMLTKCLTRFDKLYRVYCRICQKCGQHVGSVCAHFSQTKPLDLH